MIDSQVSGDNTLRQFEKLSSCCPAHDLWWRVHIYRRHLKHQTFSASAEAKGLIVSLKSTNSNVCFCFFLYLVPNWSAISAFYFCHEHIETTTEGLQYKRHHFIPENCTIMKIAVVIFLFLVFYQSCLALYECHSSTYMCFLLLTFPYLYSLDTEFVQGYVQLQIHYTIEW